MRRVLAIFWSLALLWTVFITSLPSSLWLEVTSVHVSDATVNSTPVMDVSRSINRDFVGRYIVDVEKMNARGRFTVVCTASSTTNYRVDADLPDPLLLDWWTYPVECQLGPGTYRVETSWEVKIGQFIPNKYVNAVSNNFVIRM